MKQSKATKKTLTSDESRVDSKELYEAALRLYHSCTDCKRYQEGICSSDVPFDDDGCTLFEYGEDYDKPIEIEE